MIIVATVAKQQGISASRLVVLKSHPAFDEREVLKAFGSVPVRIHFGLDLNLLAREFGFGSGGSASLGGRTSFALLGAGSLGSVPEGAEGILISSIRTHRDQISIPLQIVDCFLDAGFRRANLSGKLTNC